ncbi:MAG: hypothetical protein HZB99_03895 [Candidatus Harrisonbacteria bacterium]|nr:hypothetical protein [Candidatus Harrisonbacteria bacterium]
MDGVASVSFFRGALLSEVGSPVDPALRTGRCPRLASGSIHRYSPQRSTQGGYSPAVAVGFALPVPRLPILLSERRGIGDHR